MSDVYLRALSRQIDALAAQLDSSSRSTNATIQAIDTRLRNELARQDLRRTQRGMWLILCLPVVPWGFAITLMLCEKRGPSHQQPRDVVTYPSTPSPPAPAPRAAPATMPR